MWRRGRAGTRAISRRQRLLDVAPGPLSATDELQGRQVFTEGLGLAGGYIAEHLKEWGVQPGGDDGTYFQTVKLKGVSVKRNSSVTVTANGQSKTFKDGEGVIFDETYVHTAENRTPMTRIILLCDIERPLKNRVVRWINHVIGHGMVRAGASPKAFATCGGAPISWRCSPCSS